MSAQIEGEGERCEECGAIRPNNTPGACKACDAAWKGREPLRDGNFVDAIVRNLLDTHSPDDMLALQEELDGSGQDQFLESLTRQLAERHPEHFVDPSLLEEVG